MPNWPFSMSSTSRVRPSSGSLHGRGIAVDINATRNPWSDRTITALRKTMSTLNGPQVIHCPDTNEDIEIPFWKGWSPPMYPCGCCGLPTVTDLHEDQNEPKVCDECCTTAHQLAKPGIRLKFHVGLQAAWNAGLI